MPGRCARAPRSPGRWRIPATAAGSTARATSTATTGTSGATCPRWADRWRPARPYCHGWGNSLPDRSRYLQPPDGVSIGPVPDLPGRPVEHHVPDRVGLVTALGVHRLGELAYRRV